LELRLHIEALSVREDVESIHEAPALVGYSGTEFRLLVETGGVM
jgi:hypothetical protein